MRRNQLRTCFEQIWALDEELAQSPELAGGAGFKFEDEVSGAYLAALLTRTPAAGTGDRRVTRVALQQRDFGEPLDDLIVDSEGGDASPARLSLQVKSTLTISGAKKNSDFRDVVRDSLATLRKSDFRDGEDRYGVVVGTLAATASRTINQLIGFARNSVETQHFFDRFSPTGNASQPVADMCDMLRRVVDGFSTTPLSDAEFHRFLSHFVVIELDFRSTASKDRPAGVTRVGQALADNAVDQASLVWSRLCQMAGLAATSAGVFDRPRLLRELKLVAPLKAIAALRQDLARLEELARAWVSDIEKDVGGVILARANLRESLATRLVASRLVQLSGLPGSGKSVLLRMEVEEALARGPVLFLKHDRILGNSWAAFATANGLSAGPLEALLAEVGAVGSATLFVDGVDRIEKAHRGVVVDVVRALIRGKGLQDWRVVMTLRDSGIGPLGNWLGEALSTLGVDILEVPQLDAAEATELATTLPALETVLTSNGPVGEIARRPFFAKILQRAAAVDGAAGEVRSEVDLIRNWWLAGGYAAEGKDALLRQRAIVELGRRRARGLSKPIALNQLSPTTIDQVQDLVEDGILQFVTPGHSLRFAHDIFFEWAFFQALADRGDDWPEELVAAGQAPAFARVVELFSQSNFPSDSWAATLSKLSTLGIRSQWVRAWLLGPVGSPSFTAEWESYEIAVFADDCRWLYKALVWFQAERTTPNPNLIGGDLPLEHRIRVADTFGWPSDVGTWARLIWFLLAHLDRLPQRLRPQVTAVFAVWQNMFASMRNPVSEAILAAVQPWLLTIADDNGDDITRRRRRSDGSSQRSAYASLVFMAARAYPDPATAYLTALLASDEVEDSVFEEVNAFAPVLGQTHPALLVEIALKHLKQELPADKQERRRQEDERAAARRQAALAIPEDQRTPDQEREANGVFMSIGGRSVSRHDWDGLALDRNFKSFFPASPLRQPYPALFEHAPDEAIRLLADLSNHAMAAWRQLHTLDYEPPGTPIPLVLDFPWGRQTFWGGDREYLWSRGMWGPKPINSGYLALEDWALAQLADGADVDGLIRRIVAGNTCVAVLGVAVALALESEARSGTVATLVACQRLWAADEARFRKEVVESRASLIGFRGARDRVHIEAIERSLSRPIRRKRLRGLGQIYVLAGGKWEASIRAAIAAFPHDLAFHYEEEKTNSEAVDYYTAQAARFAEVTDLNTYTVQPTDEPGMVAVFHTPPSLDSEEALAARSQATITVKVSSLWSWAMEAFESGSLGEGFTLKAAVEVARDLDHTDLFLDSASAATDDDLIGLRRGAVAAVAAIVLKHRKGAPDTDLEWARGVTLRALETREMQDALWDAAMIIPWHQKIFAARAIASDIRAGAADDSLVEALIGLIAHPLQGVAFSAFEEAMALVDVSPALAWAALTLGFDLCDIRPRRTRHGYADPIHSAADVQAAVGRALTSYRARAFGAPLPAPPPPWLEVAGPDRKRLETLIDHDVQPDDGRRWASNPRLWDQHLAGELVKRIPVTALLRTTARDAVLTLVDQMLAWTIEKMAPTWSKDRRSRRDDAYEWDPELGHLLARVAGELDFDGVRDRIVAPITSLQGENAYALLAPFTDMFVIRYVFDDPSPPAHTMAVLDLCLDRLLQDSVFSRTSYRAGELHGFDQPALAKALMFIQIDQIANKAARFVNGDWSEVDMLLANVAKFVRAAGWSAFVMDQYLTLCERARDHYPTDHFADLALAVLSLSEGEILPGWHNTTLSARISGLVQAFSERPALLSGDLALKLLQILDLLVDLGDRRSAALQQGDNFREIQLVG